MRILGRGVWVALSMVAALASPAMAEEPAGGHPGKGIDPADTAFLMVAAALVMLMTPGLGLFYGGMVRRKNVLATFQQSFIMLGVVTVQWMLFGYSLAFSPDAFGGLIGGLGWVGLNGVGLDPSPVYAPTVPHQLHMVYQLMFAVITPALISGAFAERMKFSTYLAFTVLWATFVYDPVAHWVWGQGGWIGQKLGALDYAGGLVVHVLSGAAALCCVLVMGRRKGLGEEEMHPHNLTMTAIGTSLLWFGWFGFNAGSALAANRSAVAAFLNTNAAAAAAALSWSAIEWFHKGKATVLGTCTGAVAGLVAVTPAAGFVSPLAALAIGLLVCPVCYGAILIKGRFNYDDSLDVFGVHGVGGAFGAVATGALATGTLVKLAGLGDTGGFLEGYPGLLGSQVLSLLAASGYSVVVTFLILKVLDRVMGLRVSAEEEDLGLDLTQHGERGYIMGVGELLIGEGRGYDRDALSDRGASHPKEDRVRV